MPLPISFIPSSIKEDKSMPTILDGLESIFFNNPISAMYQSGCPVNDQDAENLYGLWQKSSLIRNANDVSKNTYGFPKDIQEDVKNRLVRNGLITTGVNDKFQLTPRAAEIIKTIVLAEGNNFQKQSVKKPFSMILAESKKPVRKSRLALAGNIIDLSKTSMAGNVPIAGKSSPNNNQEYIYNERLVNTRDGHHKEYNVRVYKSDTKTGWFEVWAFNGKIQRTQVAQPKGMFNSESSARSVAEQIMREKRNKGYRAADTENYDRVNRILPGRAAGQQSGVTATPTRRPQAPARPAAPAKRVEYDDAAIGMDGTGYKLVNIGSEWFGVNEGGYTVTPKLSTREEALSDVKNYYRREMDSNASPYVIEKDGAFVLMRADKPVSKHKTIEEANQSAVNYLRFIGKSPAQLGWGEHPPRPLDKDPPEISVDDDLLKTEDDILFSSNNAKKIYAEITGRKPAIIPWDIILGHPAQTGSAWALFDNGRLVKVYESKADAEEGLDNYIKIMNQEVSCRTDNDINYVHDKMLFILIKKAKSGTEYNIIEPVGKTVYATASTYEGAVIYAEDLLNELYEDGFTNVAIVSATGDSIKSPVLEEKETPFNVPNIDIEEDLRPSEEDIMFGRGSSSHDKISIADSVKHIFDKNIIDFRLISNRRI